MTFLTMFVNRTSLFSLFLILLTVICKNVETNREEMDGNLRRNFFNDVENFFVRIFNPNQSYKQPAATIPTVKNTNNVTVQITNETLLSTYNTSSTVLRSNGNDFQNNRTDKGYLKKNPITGNVDIDIDLISIGNSPNTDDNKIKFRKKYFRRRHGSIITDKKKVKNLIIIVSNQEKVEDQTRKANDNEHLTDEDVKKLVLRETYGNACIKVAVRKCYRTLENVNAIVCKTRYHCKSSFKSTFLLNAKRSCIVEFDPTAELNRKKRKQALKKKGGSIKRDTSGYINECIPHLVEEYANTVPKIFRNQSSEDITPILRGHPERKCQKLLRKKCIVACQRAVSKTCSSYVCGRGKKKVYKKECRRGCARKYLISSDSSDSSKSGSSD